MPVFHYRKSSYSDYEGECVEIATNIPATIAIRDSKRPNDAFLLLPPTTWASFLDAVAQGCLNRTPHSPCG
ncbi:DUF397 domain-containing protein [Streptomyces sp. NPDC050803]|uniref:DUF397 domain-containing protein n=1 Tax=unclassified Streptomyces TaxID=2593676 RepID=UPI0034243279